MEHTALSRVRKFPVYREGREHIFQSESSLTWFVRQHREQLVEAGAIVLLNGQWHAVEDAFDACVLRVGQQAAQRRGVAA